VIDGPTESGSRKKARKGGAVAQSSGATAKAIRLSAAGARNGVVTAVAPNATPSGDDISGPNKSKAKGTGRQNQRVANEMGAESASAAAGEAPQGEGLEAELPKSDQRAKKRKAGCVRVRANKASASRQRTEKSAKVSSGVPIPAVVPPPPLVTPPTRAVEAQAASDSVKVAEHAKSPTEAAGPVVTTAAHDLKWARSMRSSWTFLGSGELLGICHTRQTNELSSSRIDFSETLYKTKTKIRRALVFCLRSTYEPRAVWRTM
jgi:hypothetical protein